MKSIIRFSLKQKIFFNLLFVLLTAAGFFAMFAMPTERFPNVNFGEVTITTSYPGASPIEVETLVTRQLEEVIETIENIDWISSTSYPERSYIRLKFIDDSDYAFLYNEVRLKIINQLGELPNAIVPPVIDNVTIDDRIPVIVVNLGGQHSNRALSLMADEVKTVLKNITGVKEIRIKGEFVREFHIYLVPEKLRLNGISVNQVSSALQAVNVSVAAGNVRTHAGKYLIKVDEKFHQRNQVVKTIISRTGDGGFVRLEDLISRADLDYREPAIISSVNGHDVIAIQVIKTSAGNALEIKEDVVKALETLQPLFEKESLEVTLTRDSTIKIKDGLSTLGMNMLVGMLLVSLLIWYFMGLRNAALVTIGIPFAFMLTMLLMYLTGNSFNELSLFAFVLVTGILVDDAIVITENIYRHVQQGRDIQQAIITGVSEVALPVISSTLTTIAAFLPMLIMSGSTGEFFALIPKAVTFALIASLFECLIILPIHYLHFGPKRSRTLSERLDNDNFILSFSRHITQQALNFTLQHKGLSVLSIVLLLIVSVSILLLSVTGKLALLKIQFFPDDYSVYYADIKGPSETSINLIDKQLREMVTIIMQDGAGAAESAVGIAGFYVNEAYEPVYGNNFGTLLVTLPEKARQTFSDPLAHLEKIEKQLKQAFETDGFTIDVHAQKEGPRTGNDINVRISGNNVTSVNGLADEIKHFLNTRPDTAIWLTGFNDDRGQPKRIYRFDVLHERVSEYDLNSGEVAQLAGGILDGQYVGKYRINDEEIDLKLFIEPQALNGLQDALTIPFIEHPTSPVLLGDVTRLRTYKEQGELHRYQGQRAVTLKADIKSGAPFSTPFVINSIAEFYAKVRQKYPGASVSFGGEQASTQRSFQSLAYAFIIAVMLIYLILAAQFQSYLQPLIILAAILFALIGVILGKMMFQSLFTINSFIAIIGVAGVVVNDSLMLIDFMNKSYRSGSSRRESIDEAIKVRLRPIVLTTITTTLGLLPMALGIPEYSLVWGSMASTFVAGLATATILTLFIIPVLWDYVQARQEKQQGLPG